MFWSDSCLPWFAVYTKCRHEKRVASVLGNKGYECFLPTYSKIHANSMKYELPLFPGYVFSRLNISRALDVISTPGVFSIVGTGRNAEPIPDDQIEATKRIVSSRFTPRPWTYLAPGDLVYVAEGPLRGISGVVVAESSDRWLVISVRLLQRSIGVKLDRASLSSCAIYRGLSI
jgi:transcription antitermination factor NusG